VRTTTQEKSAWRSRRVTGASAVGAARGSGPAGRTAGHLVAPQLRGHADGLLGAAVPGTAVAVGVAAALGALGLVAGTEGGAVHPRLEGLLVAPAGDHEPHVAVVGGLQEDRKSTRLNSSHVKISYAVF